MKNQLHRVAPPEGYTWLGILKRSIEYDPAFTEIKISDRYEKLRSTYGPFTRAQIFEQAFIELFEAFPNKSTVEAMLHVVRTSNINFDLQGTVYNSLTKMRTVLIDIS